MHFLLGNPESTILERVKMKSFSEIQIKELQIVKQYFNIWNFYLGVYFEEIFQQAT